MSTALEVDMISFVPLPSAFDNQASRCMIDLQKIQDEVSETRQMVQQLLQWQKQPIHSTDTTEQLLTVGQAADLLNLTSATVYGMVYEKRIPFCKPPGSGRLYFVRSELIEWIKNGRKATTEELENQARHQIATRLNRRKKSKGRKEESQPA